MTDDVDAVLVALADPTRRRVLDVVAARGEATATMVAAELPVSRQAVVKHLVVLDRAGLVTSHRQGHEVLFTAHPERLDTAARWIADLFAEWDARLARIKRLAESDTPDREA